MLVYCTQDVLHRKPQDFGQIGMPRPHFVASIYLWQIAVLKAIQIQVQMSGLQLGEKCQSCKQSDTPNNLTLAFCYFEFLVGGLEHFLLIFIIYWE